MADKEKLYKALIKSYQLAHPTKNGKIVQIEVAALWAELKKGNLEEECKHKQEELNKLAMTHKAKHLLMWSKVNRIIIIMIKD